MKKNLLMTTVVALVVGAVGFYGGMMYGRSASNTAQPNGTRTGQFGAGGPNGQRGARTGAGFASGEILSKDATGITVKLTNGGSKIIFLSDTTKVMKEVDGTTQDLAVGTTVTANGAANPDGSINATTVQIRPAFPVDQRPTTTNQVQPQTQPGQ